MIWIRRLPLALPVLLVASVGVAAQSDVYQDNIVVVLDASGSMDEVMPGTGQKKMAVAKAALRKVMRTVPETTNVGLLVFSGKTRNGRRLKTDWIYPLGPLDTARMEQAIAAPYPDGKTPLGKYLKKGADRLLVQRGDQKGYGTFRLLVVTDGEANDEKLMLKHLPDILSRGITVDVIGVNMLQAHALATRVHSYRSANDPQALTEALTEVFAEVGSSMDATAADEAFDLLEGFPDDLAMSVLTSLSKTVNQPIGVKPPSSTRKEARDAGGTPRAGSGGPTTGIGPAPDDTSSMRLIVYGVLFAIVFISVVKGLARRSRR